MKLAIAFENVILDFDQPFMDCHLQVTVELFEIEAKVTISKVQQCLPPPFTWVVCSQSLFEMANHCNQSGGEVPVEHL